MGVEREGAREREREGGRGSFTTMLERSAEEPSDSGCCYYGH